jgi:hypothetical protein
VKVEGVEVPDPGIDSFGAAEGNVLGGEVDGGDLDAFTGEGDRVVTRPGAKVDQGAASLVPEALKEAIPEVGAALTEPPLLALRSLGVVEGD